MISRAIAGAATLASIGVLAAGCTVGAPRPAVTVQVPQQSAQPAVATTPAAPAPAAPVTNAPAPAPAPVQEAPALTDCGMDLYAGPDTSCPFAENVAGNYTGPGADEAYSPVTGLSYTMNCAAGDVLVVCTGGDNAYVQWNA